MPTATNQPAPTDHELLVDALVQTSFVTTAVLSKIAAEHDLSLTQLRALAILRDRRLRMAELADYLGLDKSTMTGLIARAEKRRLVKRAANPADGRAVDVFLTAIGQRLGVRIHAEVTTALEPLTGGLSPTDQRKLRILLTGMLGDPDR